MGDQWDWIESYCRVCNRPVADTSELCGVHDPEFNMPIKRTMPLPKIKANKRKPKK